MDLSELQKLQKDISVARRELKNIRQEVLKIKANFKSECEAIKKCLSRDVHEEEKKIDKDDTSFSMAPVGFISSCFKTKNGIPRQPSLCQSAKATLEINKTYFTNPEHSLVGLTEFSYIWILFVFNKNSPYSCGKSKVHPPRLNGVSAGIFSTRSPHRPCPIGLSLVKLDKIIGNTLFLSGVDMLDGTPVLDIKPYLPSYDIPKLHQDFECNKSETNPSLQDKINLEDSVPSERSNKSDDTNYDISVILGSKVSNICTQDEAVEKPEANNNPQMNSTSLSVGELLKMPPSHLEVIFTTRAEKDIERFHTRHDSPKCSYCLDFISGQFAAKQAITEILQNDPRSVYRRNKCCDKLYFFTVDSMHITCWFDGSVAEVLKIKPAKECDFER